MSTLIVILIISFLVIIHELGHFLLARKHKITVEEFGIGYPPKLFTLFKWQGVAFTMNAIPFGGFVRMEGENGPEEDQKEAQDVKVKAQSKKKKKSSIKQLDPSKVTGPFYTKKAGPRLSVILAGVIVNFIFGCLAFAIIFSVKGIPTPLEDQPRLAQLAPNSPAAQANLPLDTTIEAMQADYPVKPQAITSITQVQEFVRKHQGQTVTVYLSEPCQTFSCPSAMQPYQVYLRTDEEIPEGEGSMGVRFNDFYFKFYPWWQMPFRGAFYGIQQALSLGLIILVTLFEVFRDLFTGAGLPGEIAGPVGIIHQAQEYNLAGQDFFTLLNFAGMLSINLAIMNLLPIPALDGGRALFILLEKIIRKEKLEKWEAYVNYAGFALLIFLMVAVTFRDIGRWISQ